MKKLYGKVYIKIIAIILLIISVIFTITSFSLISLFNSYSFYSTKTSDEVKNIFLKSYICTQLANSKAINLVNYYNSTLDQESIPQEYLSENSNFKFVKADYFNNIVNNYSDITGYQSWNYIYGNDFVLYYDISSALEAQDEFVDRFNFINCFINSNNAIVFFMALSVAVAILSFIYLICASGHRESNQQIMLNPIDKVPLELYIAIVFGLMCMILWFVFQFERLYTLDWFNKVEFTLTIFIFFSAISSIILILISLFMTISTRIKKGTILKNTLIYIIFGWMFKKIKIVFKNLPLVWAIIIGMILLTIIEMFFIFSAYSIFYFMLKVVLTVALCIFAVHLDELKKAGRNIAEGNIDYKVNTDKMHGALRQHGNDLNSISDGISKAVNERMKSERLKTELITNVSHDIKTPLTSIVNYVDLLKKENIKNEKVNEYLEVLERQSSRLKKLTVDIVEASKATTGNIPVNFEPLNLCELLNQSIGEYEQKFVDSDLQLVASIPENEVMISADGRLLWRVFDNLLNNIIKYTQQNTRVYLSVSKIHGKAVIEFKNISKYPLNFSGAELMERFVRGDISRATEGSGLGLSIAKSLTELQNGILDLIIDGDLFKAVLTFNLTQSEEYRNGQFSGV